jgi:amino acid transporter
VPLVYALPIALINAELAAAIPADGGLVVWVQMAADEIGLSTLGIHNSWWVWNSYIFDSSIFPLLAAQYTVTAMFPGDDPCVIAPLFDHT